MNRKGALKIVTVALALAGLVAGAIPFLESLSPSATAGAGLPHLDIRDLPVGHYKYFKADSSTRSSEEHFLVLRKHDGNLDLFDVFSRGGKIFMPDVNSFQMSGLCERFSLPLPEGKIPRNEMLECFDERPGATPNEWQWDLNGKNTAKYFGDFLKYRFVIEDGYLVVGKTR